MKLPKKAKTVQRAYGGSRCFYCVKDRQATSFLLFVFLTSTVCHVIANFIIHNALRACSIRKKSNQNNASKRLFWEPFSFQNTWISIPAILLPGAEKLENIPEYLLIPEYPKCMGPKFDDSTALWALNLMIAQSEFVWWHNVGGIALIQLKWAILLRQVKTIRSNTNLS